MVDAKRSAAKHTQKKRVESSQHALNFAGRQTGAGEQKHNPVITIPFAVLSTIRLTLFFFIWGLREKTFLSKKKKWKASEVFIASIGTRDICLELTVRVLSAHWGQ